ncbi:MAG: hypothetical protein ACRD0Y_05540 [Terriglobales bacterium]
MKTTIDLPDSLLEEVKAHARARHTSLRRMMEEGLRTVLEREQKAVKPFKLRDCSQHLGQPKVSSWPEIRAIIYEGRGGEE